MGNGNLKFEEIIFQFFKKNNFKKMLKLILTLINSLTTDDGMDRLSNFGFYEPNQEMC